MLLFFFFFYDDDRGEPETVKGAKGNNRAEAVCQTPKAWLSPFNSDVQFSHKNK